MDGKAASGVDFVNSVDGTPRCCCSLARCDAATGATEEVVMGGREAAAREGEASRGVPMNSCCHSLLISRAPTDASGPLARLSGDRARVMAGVSDFRGASVRPARARQRFCNIAKGSTLVITSLIKC